MSKASRTYAAGTALALAVAGGLAALVTTQFEGTGPSIVVADVVPPAASDAGDVGDPSGTVARDAIKYNAGVRYVAYPDPARGWAVPTICYGHTAGVKRGMTATAAQCGAWLEADYKAIAQPALATIKVPLTVSQAVALADFCFNVGRAACTGSTLWKKLNVGDYAGAAGEFGRWVYAGGKRLPGLVKRREYERRLFLEGS